MANIIRMFLVGLLGVLAIGCGSSEDAKDASVYNDCYDRKTAENRYLEAESSLTNKIDALKQYNETLQGKNISGFMAVNASVDSYILRCIVDKAGEAYEASNKAAADAMAKNRNIKPEELTQIQLGYVSGLVKTAKEHQEFWSRVSPYTFGSAIVYTAIENRGKQAKKASSGDLAKCAHVIDGLFLAKLQLNANFPATLLAVDEKNVEASSMVASEYCEALYSNDMDRGFLIVTELFPALYLGQLYAAGEEGGY